MTPVDIESFIASPTISQDYRSICPGLRTRIAVWPRKHLSSIFQSVTRIRLFFADFASAGWTNEPL
jgi:hypothetical protein